MKKQILRMGIVLLCLWMLCALTVSAAPPDTEYLCRLSLRYAHDGVEMAGETVELYRVAEAHADGTFSLIAPFDGYKVSIYDVTDPAGWKTVAATLRSCAVADRLPPTRIGKTAADGGVMFSHLPTGLYLVCGLTIAKDSSVYTFDSFMVYLPTTQGEDHIYDVEATPKGSRHDNLPRETEYRVMKLWKDVGHTSDRPATVQVTLYENGQQRDTVTLSAENNWTYTWTDDGMGEWTVAEADVPQGYTAALSVNGDVFTLTNTYKKTEIPPPPPPQTGDTAPLMLYVVLLCLSGMALVLVALAFLRGERYGKKN